MQDGANPCVLTDRATLHRLPGDISAVAPPDPIPNSEVKRSCADGSVHPHARVGHRQVLSESPSSNGRAFFFLAAEKTCVT